VRSDRAATGVLAPPPAIFAASLVSGFLLEAVLGTPEVPAGARAAGVVLVLAGVGLAGAFAVALRRARTPINPRRPTRALVTSGPYRLSRNPGYLGMALASAGTALTAGALWPIATLVPALVAVDRGVIAREERHLERRFGADYAAYRRRVRRWI
jgi:protein-S-isoprenylcysteine O-methyltransferase Ste14